MGKKETVIPITIKPLGKTRWNDFERLFGKRGACGGCWCMAWRLSPREFAQRKGAGTKRAMKQLVMNNHPVGLLAYMGKEPVGWLALAPREEFIRLKNSRILAPVDDLPVWSLPCLFVAREQRRQGVSVALLKGAIAQARKHRIDTLEGYPEEPYSEDIPAAFAWKGIPSSFRKAGFFIAKQRTPKKPIMRYYVRKSP